MMKTFKVSILVALMVLGSISGVCAVGLTQDNSSHVKTIYVAKNGTDRNDGLTPNKPKRNLISALDSANSGDIIRVKAGVYTENLYINKNITLIGENQENTVIDGNHQSNCVTVSKSTVHIVGFTIKNGIEPLNSRSHGGGIRNVEGGILTVENSTITDNSAKYGGGIYNFGTMTLKGVTVKNNHATPYDGGGICHENYFDLTIENSTISNNYAKYGGGICSEGSTTLRGVMVKNNHANGDGGGIDIEAPTATIEDSFIRGNTAEGNGGGIRAGGFLYVYGTTINNNRAVYGGGITNTAGHTYVDDITMNLLTGNTPNNLGGQPIIPA
jgi:predicted outer membrane repeat protein